MVISYITYTKSELLEDTDKASVTVVDDKVPTSAKSDIVETNKIQKTDTSKQNVVTAATDTSKPVENKVQVLPQNTTNVLTVAKISPDSNFVISQSSDIEPKQIPFKVFTNLAQSSVNDYQYCVSILKDGTRASETDCAKLDKNLEIDTKIGITDLNLAPYPVTDTYPEGGYISIGDNQLEIMVALVKDDPNLVYKISGDTSQNMKVLMDSALTIEKTGVFTLTVTK